jgi:hypothetical protein
MMDFRARLVHQQAEAAERRRLDLAEQSSRLKTAEERIRIWERIHEVTLPKDPAHRLVDIIATNTGLTDSDVRDEQQRRAALRAAVQALFQIVRACLAAYFFRRHARSEFHQPEGFLAARSRKCRQICDQGIHHVGARQG